MSQNVHTATHRARSALVALLLLWSAAIYALLLVGFWAEPVARATVLMAIGLLLLWVVLMGGVMLRFRERIVAAVTRIPLDWRIRFVLFATLLAMLEEAITTMLTNAAPLLGDSSGQAAITASSNYITVITSHSVVVFLPMFIAWAGLLSWRSFSPFAVMILFGITGLLGEMIAFGTQNLLAAGSWVLVYGLMVYLPAWTAPGDSAPPRLWTYPVAILLPLALAMPLAILLMLIRSPG